MQERSECICQWILIWLGSEQSKFKESEKRKIKAKVGYNGGLKLLHYKDSLSSIVF